VLVVGAFLVGTPTWVRHVHATLADSPGYDVVQRWARVGLADGGRSDDTVQATAQCPPGTGKFAALDRLLRAADLDDVDYLVACDDDVVLPYRFLPRFLDLQSALGFAVAQPARPASTPVDHAIVVARPGLVGRQTWFVESGPVVSVHRSALNAVLPFDLTSPMGWGHEYVWAHRLRAANLRMGIVDAIPVAHTQRPTGACYDTALARRQEATLLAGQPHLPPHEAHVTVREYVTMPLRRPPAPPQVDTRTGAW
jgi:hypothetical protein